MPQGEKKGLSIFYRLLIAFLGVVAVVSISLTVVYYFFSKKSIEQHTREEISRHFNAIEYNFQHNLKDILIRDLKVLAANPVVDEFLMSSDLNAEINARAVERLFLQSVRHMKNTLSISFIDYTGIEKIRVNRAGRIKIYRDFSNDKLFRQIESSHPSSISFKGPDVDKDGNNLFSIGIYKTDPDIGEFSGAIIIKYSLENFFAYLEKIRVFGENPIWVFSPNGQVLKQPQNIRVSFDPRPHLAKKLQQTPQILALENALIVNENLAFAPGMPLMRVSISVPQSLLLKDINEVLQFLFIVSICSLFAVVIIAFSISRYFSKPIVELASAVTTFSKRQSPSSLANITATGEVKMLVDSFNKMVLDLEQTTVSRDYVDNIIKNMLDTLIVVTPEGKIQTVNSATCTLLGYDEDELVGGPFSKIISEESFKKTGLDKFIKDEIVKSLEITYLSKENREIPVLFSSSNMLDSNDKNLGIVCLAQDITERKLAEAEKKELEVQLRQAQKMEAIGTLAGGIAHDFNNILAAIIGFAELGKINIGDKENVIEAFDTILTSGLRAQKIVEQLLTFSRKTEKKKVILLLPPLIKETVKLVRSILPTTIEIHQRIDENCRSVQTDPTQIQQIILNLCNNASHAMRDAGGQITIELTEERINTTAKNEKFTLLPGEYARLSISDTGHGIPPEIAERIFDPFFTTKDVGEGTGLGLSVVHGIVSEIGGHISVDSALGKGSTFNVYLPLSNNKALNQNEKEQENAISGSGTILIVDDEEPLLDMMNRMLTHLGYEVIARSKSIGALEVFRSNPYNFDLVITDQTMPQLTGIDLAKQLLEIRKDIPVILYSGYNENKTTEELKEIGVKAFLTKPLNMKELSEIIRKVVKA